VRTAQSYKKNRFGDSMSVPSFDNLFNPLLTAIHDLGGSASIVEQEEKVAQILNLTESDLSTPHKANRSKFSYNLAWARTYLKNFGVLENSARGVWALTSAGQKTLSVNKDEVKKFSQPTKKSSKATPDKTKDVDIEILSWEDEVLSILKAMPADAFERLCQRLLRESGFVQVEVTGRSGDGGIDGKGIIKLGSILSFHVVFQCKRYKETVSSPVIRDFRGAMMGRADKGLIITTGTFTRDARIEALRDGAPPLDLVDGDDLVQMLKTYQLGVKVESKVVEIINIEHTWFQQF
jgi:restriction system protein